MDVKLESLPAVEAIRYLRNKANITTQHWDEMLGEIHAKAFTVAGATKLALLQDLRAAVQAALEQGESIGQFRKRFDQIVQEHGWDYKGQRGWRIRVIYDTNLRAAHMAGKWEQFQRTKATRPYLQYLTAGDSHVRPEHEKWDKTILPIDDAFWQTHYPPNGFGCRCTVRSLSARDLERKGLSISDSPSIERTERVNTRTGEVYGDVPEGIDAGWDYNVGQAWLAPEETLGRLLAVQPPQIAKQTDELIKQASKLLQESFKQWLKQVQSERAHRKITAVGYLFNARKATEPLSKVRNATIVITQDQLVRLQGKLDPSIIASLPTLLANPIAVLLDVESGQLIYVLSNSPATPVLYVDPSALNLIINGGTLPLADLRNSHKYKVIWGDLN